MCFDFDSRPPALPVGLALPRLAGGARAELLELTSGDGTRFSAALARAGTARDVGVVILPDVRGLYPFYEELAERFAEAGYQAIAIDYFGRTAGLGPRDDDFDYMPEVAKTRIDQVQDDVKAALEAMRERTGVRGAVAVGFCFGGAQAFYAAASEDLALDGAIGFYGILEREGRPRPADLAPRMRCPVLGLFGGADQAIPAEHIERFDRALEEAGVEHQLVTYPAAPHSFFDRKFEEFADASQDAWRRVLDFLGKVGARVGQPVR